MAFSKTYVQFPNRAFRRMISFLVMFATIQSPTCIPASQAVDPFEMENRITGGH